CSHLEENRGEDDRTGGRRFDVSIGQPRVEGEHRHLDRESEEETEEEPELQRGRDQMSDLVELQHAECCRIAEAMDVEEWDAVGIEEVEPEDREQHEHRSGERVEEELDRGVELSRPAPDADDEVHRHEHDFPEEIEEEE